VMILPLPQKCRVLQSDRPTLNRVKTSPGDLTTNDALPALKRRPN